MRLAWNNMDTLLDIDIWNADSAMWLHHIQEIMIEIYKKEDKAEHKPKEMPVHRGLVMKKVDDTDAVKEKVNAT